MLAERPLDCAIVEAFKSAMESGRSDVAEHLLCALECLCGGLEGGGADEAYRFIIAGRGCFCRASRRRRRRKR
ncbi:hypothetical protein [Manganibacter manganicus]|jgi:hypothetical protein|uniref:Uncharacterized protein n=1 Tax=Manganibacter manganicus TaxID=1873176 RepID=A0A1V8RNI9_9HYPH|nr:hypothetical protein [Pseudaminobacter manganicus]OQM74519.1 hypothetical protein BFN67_21525 [Pseudaminobacter manganicus]